MKRAALLGAGAFLFAGMTMAQTPQPAPAPKAAAQPRPPQVRVQTLRPNVVMLLTGGGNITVGYGADGAVMVDTGLAPTAPTVLAEVRKLSPGGPLTAIDTHWHYDHSDGYATLAQGGATIVAHANVKKRIAAGGNVGGRIAEPSKPEALPTKTYTSTLTIRGGGDVLNLVHPKPAHTDGDTLVKWTKADILDMGDIYVRYGLPFVDTASGGHLEGFIGGVEKGISMCGAKTIVVPGHGDPATCKDLVEYRDKLRAIADNVRGQIKAGKTLDQIKATRPADGWTQPASAFVKPDGFVEMAYQSYAKW